MKNKLIIKKTIAIMTLISFLFISLTLGLMQIVYAASSVNVIDSIVITEETNPSTVLAEWSATDPNITVYSDLKSAQAVKLFINWSDQNGAINLHEGDYFTFVIPDIFIYDYVHNLSNVDITNEFGEVVATYSIYDNNNTKEVKITFTSYVDTHTNISGDFWALLFVGRADSTESSNLEFVINGNLEAEGEIMINPSSGNLTPKDQKYGYSSPTRIIDGYYIFEWIVYINMGENTASGFNILENFHFEDVIPSDSPHVFLTDEIRQELSLASTDYVSQIGEYAGADSYPAGSRYQAFIYHYNSVGANIWYNFINWNPMVNGLMTIGIDSNNGLAVSDMEVTEKLFSVNPGTLTRPTVIRYYTVSTIKITENALGDSKVTELYKNTFQVNSGQDLTTSLNVYRFDAGASAKGISGDYSFMFTKVDEKGAALPGVMFSLFTSSDFAAGADRFVYSDINGVVTFKNLPAGIYYIQESAAPSGYIPDGTIYKVVISSEGFEIYYGDNFENKLSDRGNKIENKSEKPNPVSVILTGTKKLTGKTLTDGMFSFVVKDKDGETAATGINDADGKINFSKIEFSEPGVYTFTAEEINSGLNGISYDGTLFTITITVTDDGNGNLTAEVEYPSEGIVFNNIYTAKPVSVILTGTKNLTGKTLADGMFSFIIMDKDGETAAIGTNDSDGIINFSRIEFSKPGVYTFTAEEINSGLNGISYDGSQFTITVTVTDDGNGNLTAETEYPSGGVVFNNSYSAKPVSVILTGTKNLTGKTLADGMFSFVVKDKDEETAATGTNDADGKINFSKIEFSEPDVYTFTAEEVNSGFNGISYNSTQFTITITVTDDGNGNLTAEVNYPNGGIIFNNSYTAKPVSVILTGTKKLTGKILTDGMFSFVVKDKDRETAATGTNDADGKINFSKIEFSEPGVYTFTAEEVNSGLNGISYDGTLFTITVTVTDDENGNLTAEVEYQSGGIVFNNNYDESSTPNTPDPDEPMPDNPKTGVEGRLHWVFIIICTLALFMGIFLFGFNKKQQK